MVISASNQTGIMIAAILLLVSFTFAQLDVASSDDDSPFSIGEMPSTTQVMRLEMWGWKEMMMTMMFYFILFFCFCFFFFSFSFSFSPLAFFFFLSFFCSNFLSMRYWLFSGERVSCLSFSPQRRSLSERPGVLKHLHYGTRLVLSSCRRKIFLARLGVGAACFLSWPC